MSECRSCGARILWVGTEHGKAMPLDALPYTGDDPRGLFVVRRVLDGGRQKVVGIAVPPDVFADELRYRSHFATCPNAAEHRRG